ncbi:uncharacterized protein [Centruroides vittatus]|uniref:uncharacterized protein n=1 Tax=Centruroides vittatus TaxID=120091 RepID=UPI00350F5A1A
MYIHQARFRLASHCTVNQAESLAINKALLWITENKKVHNITRVTILSDSRVALLQLKKLNTKLSIIQDSVSLLLTLRHSICIRFSWVRGHSGVRGNDRADLLARSAPVWIQRHSYSHTPVAWLKESIRNHSWKCWQGRWDNSSTGRITYNFILDVLQRSHCKHLVPTFQVTQLLTGHGNFRSYLNRFLRKTDGKCPCSLHEDEDAGRVIWHCPAYNAQRKVLISKIQKENELWLCRSKTLINNSNIFKALRLLPWI